MTKYDLTDPWDKMLIEMARQTLTGGSFDIDAMDIDPTSDEECWDFAIMFDTDGQCPGSTNDPCADDSFGPWGGKLPEGCREIKISEAPKEVVNPEAVILLNRKGHLEVQFYSEKQTEHLKDNFVVRVWNNKQKREFGNRFYASKLSWAMTAAWDSILARG